MHRLTRISLATATFALGTGLALSACSSDKSGTGDSNGSSAGSANGSAGHGGSSATSGNSAVPGAGSSSGGSNSVGTGGSSASSGAGTSGVISTDACPGLPFDGQAGAGEAGAGEAGAGDTACTGVSVEAEAVPVDLFIMMDRSQSMGLTLPNSTMTRWDAVKAAVQSFASAPSAGAIGAGIGFFGQSGGADDTLDCNVAAYAKPAVAIGPLAMSGAALVSAIDKTPPAGLTPTVPALEGALSYAKAWATAHTGRATVVVLVTDGFPTQCSKAPSDVAAAAQAGYADTPSIKTYVIGIGDVAKFNLDNYAQAGGTKTAFLTDQANVSDTFLHALLNISDSTLACEYAIPKPSDPKLQVDPDKVQIVYTPASGEPLEVPKVPALGGCANAPNGGWFYDDPAAPTKISVCPCTCSSFAAGRVDVRLGCSPRISLR
ncbi:MAG TPA: vWA domain-containing protein [Polyangiaceae bacterium]|jgi:hypothetical protein|nr:vWA domain-containing protein [Polyangiaceae bacterium]